MSLQTPDWQDLSSLATLLRDSGDQVLCGNSKLKLTPALLSKLNVAFSGISLLGFSADFQVTSAHASQPSATTLLHFLHDFVQKTIGLTIAGGGSHQHERGRPQTVDLSRFRSLRHLELRSCMVGHGSDSRLEGLSPLRLQLEALVLMHIYHKDDLLWDVLANGAVTVGQDILWIKLSQLVVSYCGLRSLGSGLSLACNLQWLDASHNMLSDADTVGLCLINLPKLCYLNLSYNRLSRIPVPSSNLSCPHPKLQILLLSHNYIENLEGLQHLTSLKELNLEVNQLHDHSSLQPLRPLSQLQHLKLNGNPLCYHKRYRILASSFLPPRAVFLKHRYRRDAVKLHPFMLDGQKLSEPELQAVRDGPISLNSVKTDHAAMHQSAESSKVHDVSGSEIERSSRKSRTVREVIIKDFDTLDDLADISNVDERMAGSLESSGEHLHTKKQLENVRAHFGQNWLRAQAGYTVQELLGLQPSSSIHASTNLGSSIPCISAGPLSSSTPLASPGKSPAAYHQAVPYPGHLDVQALENMILKRSPDSKEHSDATLTTHSSQYQTANESDTILHVSLENDETIAKDSNMSLKENDDSGDDADHEGEGFSGTVNEEADDEIEDIGGGDHANYLVNEVIQGHCSSRDLFLVITSRYIKEVESSSGSVVKRWLIDTLDSCVLLSANPCRIQLTFNTVVQSKKERIYQMELNDAQKYLLPSLKAILETRSLTALNVAAFRCMCCSGEFSVELNSRKVSKVCPTCGSTLVFQLDEAPLPSLGSSTKGIIKPFNGVAADSTKIPESTAELLHSPSDSSIGSAASLESPAGVVQQTSESTSAPTCLRRCESDIDIISNPSQSSIEVLDDVSRASGTPGRKRSSEERQVVAVPNLLTVPEVSSPLAPVPAGLTESSSSGSLTDSVCTAYENNIAGNVPLSLRRETHRIVNSVLKEESRENSPSNKEDPTGLVETSSEPSSLSNVLDTRLDNLLQSLSSKILATESMSKKTKNLTLESAIQYNYVDFSTVDHRLKLHLHLSIFDADEREVLQILLRGEVLTRAPETRYPGILVISNQRVYVMKITGPEEGDVIDRWISRVVALPLDKLLSISALPWNAGICLSFQGTALNNLIVILRDQQYTFNLFKFMKQSPKELCWKIENTPPEKHSLAVSGILQHAVKEILPDSDPAIRLAALLCSTCIAKDEEEQNHSGCLLLATSSGLILINDNLSWLLPPESSSPAVTLKSIGKQSICNLIQVEAHGPELCLQFLDEAVGGEEIWRLSLQSLSVLEQVVGAIRGPWEDLFSVPLQVLEANKV